MKINKVIENSKKRTEYPPTSQRKYVIDGKQFNVTRHFEGEKPLNTIVAEIATHRANKEMGLY